MKVIVVGAGIAGLGAAHYFAARGHSVTILEAGDRVGGRAVTYERPGSADRVDCGTQYFHTNYRRARALINHAGLGGTLSVINGFTRIYEARAADASFLFNRRLPWYRSVGIRGNLRLGMVLARALLLQRRDPFTLDRSPGDAVAALAAYADPVVRRCIIEPLAAAGALSDGASLQPSMHHLDRLIRIILSTGYLSLDSGTASLCEALALDHRVQLETRVERLICTGEGTAGVELSGSGKTLTADHVVLATPPAQTASMLPMTWHEERRFLEAIEMPAFVLPVFFLDRPLEVGVWSYMMPPDGGGLISYFTDASRKNPRMVPSGKAAVQPWVCYPQSRRLIGLSNDKIVSSCLQEIENLFPGFSSWVEHVHVERHAGGVPFHGVHHEARAREFVSRMAARGVSACGDYLSGGYMESALWSAEFAAQTVYQA